MAAEKRIFETIHNGEIEFCLLTRDDVEEALEVLQTFFFRENICKSCDINLDLPESIQARKDLTEVSREIIQDRISIVAKHVPTGKIIGGLLNKIQWIPKAGEIPAFVKYTNELCKSPNAKALMDLMINVDERVDVFKMYNCDCLLEGVFLFVATAYEGRGVGRTLFKCAIQLARELSRGIGIENLPDELKDKRPKIVTALFTSMYSQKVGAALNFEFINRVPYTEFTFNGKTYAEKLDPIHVDCAHVVFKL